MTFFVQDSILWIHIHIFVESNAEYVFQRLSLSKLHSIEDLVFCDIAVFWYFVNQLRQMTVA